MVDTPLPLDFNSEQLPEIHTNYHEPFHSIYGKVLFISHWRPDISIAKTKLAQFMHKYSSYHWECLMHLCTYLHYNRDLGMIMKRSPTWEIGKTKCVCISDAGELANPNSKSRSIIGHVLILEGNIVSFKSKLSTCVNTDASHAELVGLYAATKKIKCIEFIFKPFA